MLPIVFNSNEQGAPTLNNAAGSLISVLDACLVTGFNSVGITSVTIAGNVATVVTSAAHGLTAGMRGTVAGVSITAANGDKTVASVPTTTSFTYPCVNPDVSESPVSASVKRTPLGWAKQFSKTNVAMYKSSDPAAYGQSLLVDDTGTNSAVGARVFGVENPTSIDAWSDKFPQETQIAGGLYWGKGANSTAAKAWCIVGDERFFYLLTENTSWNKVYSPTAYSFHPQGFGDIISFKNGEGFGSVIFGSVSALSVNSDSGYLLVNQSPGTIPTTAAGAYICRQQTGILKSVQIGIAHPYGREPGSTSFPRYPSPVDNGLTFSDPAFVCETLSYANNPMRGVLPGMASVLANHNDLPITPFPTKFTTTDGSNKAYLVQSNTVTISSHTYGAAFCVKLNESWR